VGGGGGRMCLVARPSYYTRTCGGGQRHPRAERETGEGGVGREKGVSSIN